MDDNNKYNISVLLLRLIEGSLNDSEIDYLRQWLNSGPEAKAEYLEFIEDYSVICNMIESQPVIEPSGEIHLPGAFQHDLLQSANTGQGIVSDSNVSFMGFDLGEFNLDDDTDESKAPGVTKEMLDILEWERTSPAVEIPKEEPKRELIQKVVYPPSSTRKVSKFEIITLITSAAAVLLLVLFIKFAPAHSPSVEVATLIDQMNVKWSPSTGILKNGRRLWTDEGPFELKKGIVKIQYDEGVEVMIEGPAVFQIQRTGIYLEYGSLYSHVSASGLGYKVETPTSQFIDMGTEFGVQADVNGSSELHVTKGKVQLFAGISKQSKTGQMVTEKNAVRFNANNGRIKSIPLENKAFVRQFDSKTGFVLRGQKLINPDLRLNLLDDMQAYSDESMDFHGAATLGGNGIWDTQFNPDNPTANIRTDQKDGSMTLRVVNHSLGGSRCAAVHDLEEKISDGKPGIVFFRLFSENSTRENVQFVGLHHYSGDDPIKASNSHRKGIAAGFGLVDTNRNPSGNSLDIITTGDTPVVLGRLQQGRWYDVWIVADNSADTFDLYIRPSSGPGSGYPGLPHSDYLVDSGIPFGIPTADPLTGIMFLCDEASTRTSTLWIDDIYWNGGSGM